MDVAEFDTRSGIYRIRCRVTGKSYIGSAVNLTHRRAQHFYLLRRNRHDSRHLQFAWNKYGEQQFVFEAIELVPDKTQLIAREQYWLDTRRAETGNRGYNIRDIADSSLGHRYSPEALANITAANRSRARTERDIAGRERMRGHPTPGMLAAVAKRKAAGYVTEAGREAYRRMKERGTTPAQRAANARRKGAPLTEKQKARYERLRGTKASADTRRKLSANMRKRHAEMTPERRAEIGAAISRATRGLKRSAEGRKNIADAHRGIPWSPARRAAQLARSKKGKPGSYTQASLFD